jgi:hypothetical protein
VAGVPIFAIDRSAKVHNDDMLDVHKVVQCMPCETVLFHDEVIPARESALEDNSGERITRQNFSVGRPQKRNFG